MRGKNPRTPPPHLTVDDGDVIEWGGPLWRVHRAEGVHTLPWNRLRTFGPARSMRWDPHPLPVGDHPAVGVSYTAADPTTAFAEVFQATRAITRTGELALAGWEPTRALRMLDLRGTWALRNGASASLPASSRSTCRAWAQQIHRSWPDLDGLIAPSTMTGRPSAVLFTAAASSFPDHPRLARRLDDRALDPIIGFVAEELRWMVR